MSSTIRWPSWRSSAHDAGSNVCSGSRVMLRPLPSASLLSCSVVSDLAWTRDISCYPRLSHVPVSGRSILSSTDAEEAELDLDGSVGVLLAPIRGRDLRRNLDPGLFAKRPALFTAKFGLAVAAIAACWLGVGLVPRWWM